MPKRGSSRAAAEAVTFATWGPPPPLQAGPSPRDLFAEFVHHPKPGQVNCDGTDPWDIPWLASWGLYPQLYALGRLLSPHRILEIGTLYGHGIAAVMRGAGPFIERVDVIDAETYFDGGYLARARENLQAVLTEVNLTRRYRNAPPVRLTVWQWDTKDGLPFEDRPPPGQQRDWFHMVLVDGDHTYEGKRRDLGLAWSYLLPGGHLYVDDVHSMPQVRQAVQDFAKTVKVASVLELFTRTTDRPRGAYLLEKGEG